MTAKKHRRTTEFFRAEDLYVDPVVQRRLKPRKIRELTGVLDLDALGVFTVNIRKDGRKSVVDGQHRREALIVLDMSEWKVKCDTYWGLPIEDEHRLWRRLNDSSPASVWDDFRSGLQHGDDECVEIAEICETHGFKVANQKRDGQACAIAALRRVHSRGVLDDTFSVIEAAWGSIADAADGKVVEGIGIVCEAYDGELDRAALATKIGKTSPAKMIADARVFREYNGGSIPRAIAQRVVDMYNRGRRSGALPPL